MHLNIQNLIKDNLVTNIDLNLIPARLLLSYDNIIDDIDKNIDRLDRSNKLCISGFSPKDYLSEMRLHTIQNDYDDVHKCIHGKLLSFQNLSYPKRLIHHLADLFPKHSIHNTGGFLYEKGGYMGWHTNNDFQGYRLYITHCDKDSESFFRYFDSRKKEIVTLHEKKGYTARLFKISKDEPLWHCVYSDCNRHSIGYYILDNL